MAGSLPQALAKAGNEVAVILPLYQRVSDNWKDQMSFVCNIEVPLGWTAENWGYWIKRGLTALRFYYTLLSLAITMGYLSWPISVRESIIATFLSAIYCYYRKGGFSYENPVCRVRSSSLLQNGRS